jgi:hypothetical protein
VETFVVRIWTAAEHADDPERFRLRGLVERVQSGEQAFFKSAGELLAFLEGCLEPGAHDIEHGAADGRYEPKGAKR